MKITGIIMLLVVALFVGLSSACGSGSSEEESSPVSQDSTIRTTVPPTTAVAVPTATPTVTPSPEPSPTPDATLKPSPSPTSTEPPECEEDRQAIKAVLDTFHAANGNWPTVNGQPGKIVWGKVVPDLLEKRPSTYRCEWQVNSDPLGEVCRSKHC